MTDLPDSAIEAAARILAFGDTHYADEWWETFPEKGRYRKQARDAVEAAMPAIRDAMRTDASSRMTDDAKARRALWREAAEKGIEQGVDWPRIVLTLFGDIDNLREAIAQEIETATLNLEGDLARTAERVMAVLDVKHQCVAIVRGGTP